MTRKEVYNYFVKKGFEQFPPNEFGKANCIGFRNPATGLEIYMDTPINDSPMRDFKVGQLCSQIGAEPPPGLEHIKPIVDEIAQTDFTGFPPKKKGAESAGPSLN